MKLDFYDIELAFDYVSSAAPFTNTVAICKNTGRMYYSSDLGDTDEDFPIEPDEDDYFFIPHKNDLDLGTRLVRRFANELAPHLADEIRIVFSRRGAYSRFKQLLHDNDLLDSWHNFELTACRNASRQWCRDNGIELDESLPKHAS